MYLRALIGEIFVVGYVRWGRMFGGGVCSVGAAYVGGGVWGGGGVWSAVAAYGRRWRRMVGGGGVWSAVAAYGRRWGMVGDGVWPAVGYGRWVTFYGSIVP